MTTLKLYYRTVYGRTLWYPADQATRELFAVFGAKSLSVQQVAALGGSGAVEIYRVPDPAITG